MSNNDNLQTCDSQTSNGSQEEIQYPKFPDVLHYETFHIPIPPGLENKILLSRQYITIPEIEGRSSYTQRVSPPSVRTFERPYMSESDWLQMNRRVSQIIHEMNADLNVVFNEAIPVETSDKSKWELYNFLYTHQEYISTEPDCKEWKERIKIFRQKMSVNVQLEMKFIAQWLNTLVYVDDDEDEEDEDADDADI